MAKNYRIVVAKTEEGLVVAADEGWKILKSTIREFRELETNDDLTLGNIGAVTVAEGGFVALAFMDVD